MTPEQRASSIANEYAKTREQYDCMARDIAASLKHVIAEEREACAKLVEAEGQEEEYRNLAYVCPLIAAAIRAREPDREAT